ncbi:NADP-dependent oxidoreductase domain-containing protein [Trametes elegans]|nr:NADP-dependent oxidoreductase domain-containing protein [Trametes elegans]
MPETNPTAEYRQLGESGLRESVPIFGGMTVGNSKWSHNIPRENLVTMTKAFFFVPSGPSTLSMLRPDLLHTKEYVNQGVLSRAALFNQVDASLWRLRTSYIDVLQIHTFDPTTSFAETMKALHDLVQGGKMRYLGAANVRAWQFAEMQRVTELNGWAPSVSVQVEYSPLYRVDVSGPPFDKWRRESDNKIIERVEELAQKKGWSMAQAALAWVAAGVTAPITGANTPARLSESITTGKGLSEEEL